MKELAHKHRSRITDLKRFAEWKEYRRPQRRARQPVYNNGAIAAVGGPVLVLNLSNCQKFLELKAISAKTNL